MIESRLPAEWEPQSGVMLTWPHDGTDWAPALDRTLPVFAQIGTAISQDEALLNVCRDAAHEEQVRKLLIQAGAKAENLHFGRSPSNDTWARDHAPITTLNNGQPVLNDFVFDGWGKKFPADLDTAINREIHRQGVFGTAKLAMHELVLEGGAIETDGHGTLLATRSSVLDTKRNPRLDAGQVERQLRDSLGITRFLWLDHGELSGDDTDAHIDVLARFTDPQTIVYTSAPEGDADHRPLQEMYEQLRTFKDPEGRPYRLRALPFPGVLRDRDGRRLSAGYANFLITNRSVLLPVFDVPADAQAAELLADCFPGRRIVRLDCRPIIEQNGSLHCLTMQFPAAISLQSATTA
jgi:agmatine/peptidylarginine deiminase